MEGKNLEEINGQLELGLTCKTINMAVNNIWKLQMQQFL